MKKEIRGFLSVTLCLCLFVVSGSAYGASMPRNTENMSESNIVVIAEHAVPINDQNVTYTAHDGRISNDSIAPRATVIEEYVSSTYAVKSYGIVAHNVGPRENDIFLLSVPKGGTRTIQSDKEVSASVVFSGNVEFGIKKVVNLKLGLDVSGSFTHKYSLTKSYSGPEGNYTTRDYYGAVQYDEYAFTVTKTDKYAVYKILPDGSKSFLRYEYVANDVYLNNVKQPKAIEYYRDFNN